MNTDKARTKVFDLTESSPEFQAQVIKESKDEAIKRIQEADFFLVISGKEREERVANMEISGHHQPHQIPAILDTMPRARLSLIKCMAQAVISVFSQKHDGT